MWSLIRNVFHGKERNANWWKDSFTPEQRLAIEGTLGPLAITSAETLALSTDPLQITILVAHLKKEGLREHGYKLLERADSMLNHDTPIASQHFYWAARGEFYYRWRDLDGFALEESIRSFERQTALAPIAVEFFRRSDQFSHIPAHSGYRQLRIIEEKKGNFERARQLCICAKEEGWADDWDKQISRIENKMAKLKR